MNSPAKETTDPGGKQTPHPIIILPIFLIGLAFGILLIKSEVADWHRVHKMFRFEEARMYLIIGAAVFVAMVSILIIRRLKTTSLTGKPYRYQAKPFQPGVIIGGTLFGVGWAITGACPGPIYAQIGSGEWMALVTLAGALIGMFLFAFLKPLLPSGAS